MATAQLDIRQLSSYFALPQTTITTILDAPTAELVQTLLTRISAKAREHDEVASEKLKLEVELENAVRTGETKNRVLKNSVDKGLKEISDLRQKLQVEENSRAAVESELQTLKSSTSSTISEVAALNSRIASLESSNRDTLSLLESKSSAYDRLTEDLTTQHQKTVELRRAKSELEQALQSANAALSTAKFREQGLRQEIESLKRTNEWLDKELKTKSGDYSRFRKEKSARIAELQRQNEEATSTVDALRRTESTLRQRLEELGQKADDYLSQIERLQEEDSRKEEAFRVELDSANRLAELMKNSAHTERQRHQDLQSQVEQLREDAAEEIGRISAETETEHENRELAERKVAELEVQVERLEADLGTLRAQGSTPGTPRLAINGHAFGTPGREGSPARGFSPSSSRIKAGLSMTQMYSEYSNAKAELEAEKRRNDQLSSTIDDMIQDLETRQPEIEELRADHDRLESDIVEMSSLVDTVGKERDQAKKEAKRWEGQVGGLMREGEVLRQQLRDLSSQVKMLLLEVHIRDQGLQDLTLEDRTQLEQVARGEIDVDGLEGTTDTNRLISQHLTTFKSINDLQAQNTNLLKATRELGDRMEGEEARRKRSKEAQTEQELLSLREKVERFKDEMQSTVTQSQSYIRERDMFRRMLSHRGQLPPGSDLASMFGESVDGGAAPATPIRGVLQNSIEQSPTSKDLADYAKLVKDLQDHFDAYRQESATDRATFKQQVDSLSKQNGELRGEAARSNSQVTLAHERYEMLQSNYNMLKTENNELQKRSHILSDSAAKQDLRTQQVAEDLVEAKGLLESMRNEIANLKAEKEFWRSVEKRLTEDNEGLLNDRARLNTLNTGLQNLLNEREQTDSEIRRKLQGQVESLESELQSTQRKLSDEIEGGKRRTLRKEYEHGQSQKRIDDLVASLSAAREELIEAKTTRGHLQARVDELSIELKSAEERMNVLQPRLTARLVSQPEAGNDEQVANGDDPSLSKEQELAVEVSELKRDLELTRSELENAKGQVEQYKAISQASEEELHSLNDTHDQYRQDLDKVIEEKDAKVRDLQQRIEDISSELATTNSELSDLRSQQAEHARRMEEQKTTFEAELAQLKDQDDRHATAAQFHQADLRAQAEIAQQAQQNYEDELVKHAEAAKALQKVRNDYNQLKLEVVEMKTEVESTRTSMAQSEESWAEAKGRYERELADLRARREDVNTQNKLLHQQLENVTGQISALQHKRATAGESEEESIVGSVSAGLDNLQEVIKYLRREKEIVDIQLELSSQEGKRLKQQLDYTQSQLDETRLKLNQQRRAESDMERNALNHKKLMETITELNLFRESSVTLRNEARQAQASLLEKSKRVDELVEQIQPLAARVRELENDKETLDGEKKLLQEDRDRWEQRTQNILQKYDRIDPAELDALKEQIAILQKERDEFMASKQALQEQVDSIPDQIKQVQDQANERQEGLRARLTEQFKGRSKDLNAKIRELNEALQTVRNEMGEMNKQLEDLKGELAAVKSQRDQALANARTSQNTGQSELAGTASSNGVEEGQVNEDAPPGPSLESLQALQEKVNAAEAKASEEAARSSTLQNEVATLEAKVLELERQINESQQNLDAANAQIAHLQAQLQSSKTSHDECSEEVLHQLRQDLAHAQQEAETLRNTVSVSAPLASASVEDGGKSFAEHITERVETIRTQLESQHSQRVKELDERLEKRTEGMRGNLKKRLTEGKEQARQQLQAEYDQNIQLLKTEHDQKIEALKARHQAEIDELKRSETTRAEQHQQQGLAEHAGQSPAPVKVLDRGAQPSGAEWQPTEEQIKHLFATNGLVKNILSNSIRRGIKTEQPALIASVKEEQQKLLAEKLQDAEIKAITAKDQAVLMEGKRYGVKISMAENRFKAAQAKIEIVQKAATDTPERPVAEVWEIAKDAKPPPAAPQPARQAGQAIKQTSSFEKPTPSVQGSQAQSQGTFGQPTLLLSLGPRVSQSQAQPLQQSRSNANPFVQPSEQVQASPNVTQTQTTQQPPSALQQGSNLPAKPPQTQYMGQRSVAGTGPAVLRGAQQSGLPVLRGAARGGAAAHQSHIPQGPQGQQNPPSQRGTSNIARARGRGGTGRGAPHPVTTNLPQVAPPAQASPGSATSGLNAGAKQFVPVGNKRAREDGPEGGDTGSGGKRIRGEGGES
ncbi:Tetratricopeptide, MLP1/MLP2-like [Lasallia pustulata]|uniref:Tetratricopeptide, MLP1/MLP2-like n=1 Tax=Lasallia pustulata TaxID=136370 RepID=A0A1W5CR78_9LECA|nr:Tetratricopeptide, MLP1/MLP2-like [Lasallia pustulata]